MIDTHCHLDDNKFNNDLKEILSRAKEEGIEKIICPSTDLNSYDRIIEICSQNQGNIYPALGIHPSEADKVFDDLEKKFKQLIKETKPIAIGEIGLDYYWTQDNKEKQKELFITQLAIAEQSNLPVIIHNRSSTFDCLEILSQFNVKGVFHCFSEDFETGMDVINKGFFLSFTGNITYPKSEDLRKLVKEIPINSFMLETDAPYLSPQVKRGRRNEPGYVRFIYEYITELREIGLDELDQAINNNVKELFNIN